MILKIFLTLPWVYETKILRFCYFFCFVPCNLKFTAAGVAIRPTESHKKLICIHAFNATVHVHNSG